MSTPKDGGPAFPQQSIGPEFPTGYCGMSLRDWFAGQALAGAIQSYREGGCERTEKDLAESCYSAADAMLAAREKGGAV